MTTTDYQQQFTQLFMAVVELEQAQPPAFKQWQNLYTLISRNKHAMQRDNCTCTQPYTKQCPYCQWAEQFEMLPKKKHHHA